MYDNVAVLATAQREHEAAIELLLLVMLSDRHISSDEIDSIRVYSDDSGFESDTFAFDQYLGTAVAKVRTALHEHSTEALLDSIEERVASRVLRQSLFAAAREVAEIDDDVHAEEEDLLGQIAVRFG